MVVIFPSLAYKIMRRKDFNSSFIANILYVLVKIGINNCLQVSFPYIGIYLVRYIKIIKAGLKNKWFWITESQFRFKGSINQSLVHIPPWYIISKIGRASCRERV